MVTKIAMIADLPDSHGQIDGGVQAVTSYLVSSLCKIPEVELHVLSFRLGIQSTTIKNEPNLVRYYLPFSRLGTITGFAKDQAVLNACLAQIQPHVVHSQGGGHDGIVARRSGYPTVITIHGIGTQEANYLTNLRRRFRTRIQGWMSNYYCIRQASHTIVISPYVASHFGTALKGQQYLIPNPIHEQFFGVVRREVRGRILFAGRLYALKGVKDLLQAVSKLSLPDKPMVVLAGSTADRQYVDELKNEASRLNMSQNVDFRGILTTEELLLELSRSTCLVLPSYQETAPMVIQESMAAGLPVVASDVGGIPYQITDGQNGLLFPSGDVCKLTDCLNSMLTNDNLRLRFSHASRSQAEKEYRASSVAEQTLDVYKEIIGK